MRALCGSCRRAYTEAFLCELCGLGYGLAFLGGELRSSSPGRVGFIQQRMRDRSAEQATHTELQACGTVRRTAMEKRLSELRMAYSDPRLTSKQRLHVQSMRIGPSDVSDGEARDARRYMRTVRRIWQQLALTPWVFA